MNYNDLTSLYSLMDIVAPESEEGDKNAQLKRLSSFLAKKSLIKGLNPSVRLKWIDPTIINIPDSRETASSVDSKIDSIKNKQHRSESLKRREWLDTKKRQLRYESYDREAAQNEGTINILIVKRRHFFDTDWDELWYFPGN